MEKQTGGQATGGGGQGAAWVSRWRAHPSPTGTFQRKWSPVSFIGLGSQSWSPENEKQDVLPVGSQAWASAWLSQLGDRRLLEVLPPKHLLRTLSWMGNRMPNSK